MARTYICPTHKAARTSWCEDCVADFEHRRHRDDMSGDERAAELSRITHCVTIPLDMLRTRVDELVGRPVYTHEIGMAFDALLDEARTNDHPSERAILSRVPARIPVIAVETGGGGRRETL